MALILISIRKQHGAGFGGWKGELLHSGSAVARCIQQ